MSKSVSIEISDSGGLNIEWDGDLNGVCCGPEESELKDKLRQLGVELETRGVYCKLPEPDRTKAKVMGICVEGGKSNG